MPTYVYICAVCGPMDIVQKITEKPHRTCPDCKGTEFRKSFAVPAISFKGNGFYSTDKGK